ncbi:MAG: 30S ribosomal protein S27ae [Candidatus Diapherotrites archaeon]|nr:30S ribosomal protein S27ae [Candidatus Diapherotrites archaeon]
MAEKKEKKKKSKSSLYDASGEKVKRKNKSCPKCGAGVFLAEHKNRLHCGKCGYMQKK